MTKVIFLIEKDSASEVFAYFPENKVRFKADDGLYYSRY